MPIRFLLVLALFLLGARPALAQSYEEAANAYAVGDFARAAEIWLQLGDEGDANAQFNLGVLYEQGRGLPLDPATAAQWYAAAAGQGHAPALNNLGLLLRRGHGVARNDVQAAQLFARAAENGYAPAQYNLGLAYLEGLGVERSEETAAQWFRRAAEMGYAPAQYNLASLYATGRGLGEDQAAALYWYEQAAEAGDPAAQFNLASLLLQAGREDEGEAWLQRAARQGLVPAQRVLGTRLANKDTADLEIALMWLMIAANLGEPESEGLRDQLLGRVSPETAAAARARASGFVPQMEGQS